MTTRTITGKVTPRCYAAALQDCDGGPVTGEHYVTEALLERIRDLFGPQKFIGIAGHARLGDRRAATIEMLQSNILCDKHNGELSDCDQAACDLFDALLAYLDGRGHRAAIKGEDLERWAFKVLAGILSAGVVPKKDGTIPKERPGEGYLRMLFHGAPLPPKAGLYHVSRPRGDFATAPLHIMPSTFPKGHPAAGEANGICIEILGLILVFFLGPFALSDRKCTYRPQGFTYGTLGEVRFSWDQPAGAGMMRLSVDAEDWPHR